MLLVQIEMSQSQKHIMTCMSVGYFVRMFESVKFIIFDLKSSFFSFEKRFFQKSTNAELPSNGLRRMMLGKDNYCTHNFHSIMRKT